MNKQERILGNKNKDNGFAECQSGVPENVISQNVEK